MDPLVTSLKHVLGWMRLIVAHVVALFWRKMLCQSLPHEGHHNSRNLDLYGYLNAAACQYVVSFLSSVSDRLRLLCCPIAAIHRLSLEIYRAKRLIFFKHHTSEGASSIATWYKFD